MQGRREMMAGTFGLATAAANRQALAEAAAPKKRDSRLGFLAVAPAVALGWVGFNILGPATAQLDSTNDRVADIAAGKRRADPAKPRFGVKVKGRLAACGISSESQGLQWLRVLFNGSVVH